MSSSIARTGSAFAPGGMPACPQPRPGTVFPGDLRTVSVETASTTSGSTSLSPSSFRFLRHVPREAPDRPASPASPPPRHPAAASSGSPGGPRRPERGNVGDVHIPPAAAAPSIPCRRRPTPGAPCAHAPRAGPRGSSCLWNPLPVTSGCLPEPTLPMPPKPRPRPPTDRPEDVLPVVVAGSMQNDNRGEDRPRTSRGQASIRWWQDSRWHGPRERSPTTTRSCPRRPTSSTVAHISSMNCFENRFNSAANRPAIPNKARQAR